MTEALKFVAIGMICAILCVLVRQYRPELEPFVQMGGIITVAVFLFEYLKKVLDATVNLLEEFDVLDASYFEVIIKVLGIAIITKIGTDVCADSGNNALATNVELAGKVMILFLCFSLIKTIAQLAVGLLE